MQDVGLQYLKFTGSSNTGCSYSLREEDNGQSGQLTITRLDLQNQIIAGTFSFTLTKKDCDTVRITDGRFDLKF
jgi:hypothetical protein